MRSGLPCPTSELLGPGDNINTANNFPSSCFLPRLRYNDSASEPRGDVNPLSSNSNKRFHLCFMLNWFIFGWSAQSADLTRKYIAMCCIVGQSISTIALLLCVSPSPHCVLHTISVSLPYRLTRLAAGGPVLSHMFFFIETTALGPIADITSGSFLIYGQKLAL